MRAKWWILLAVQAACAKTEKPPAAAPQPPPPPPAPAPISLADVAGKWTLRTMPEGRDTTITAELVATATTEGWTMTLPNQKPQPIRVRVDSDSIMADVGPFPSVLRKGAMVITNSVYRLQDGKLVGSLVAHYRGPKVGADSTMRGRQEATRNP